MGLDSDDIESYCLKDLEVYEPITEILLSRIKSNPRSGPCHIPLDYEYYYSYCSTFRFMCVTVVTPFRTVK